jgi:hypothetical protein
MKMSAREIWTSVRPLWGNPVGNTRVTRGKQRRPREPHVPYRTRGRGPTDATAGWARGVWSRRRCKWKEPQKKNPAFPFPFLSNPKLTDTSDRKVKRGRFHSKLGPNHGGQNNAIVQTLHLLKADFFSHLNPRALARTRPPRVVDRQ